MSSIREIWGYSKKGGLSNVLFVAKMYEYLQHLIVYITHNNEVDYQY